MNMTATPNVARFNEGEFTPRAWHLVANNLAGSRQQAWHKYQNSHDREHAYLRDVPASVRTLPARTHAIAVICVIGLSIAAVLITSRVAEYVLANRTPIAGLASPNLNASRFMLNGLLVPALDSDAMPLRWVDPRPALACGPGSSVYVNGRPLVSGARVPVKPFTLEWHANGCHPFGAQGPRFDGSVTLTVFTEDSGFRATVNPSHMRVTSAANETTFIEPGEVSMPQSSDEHIHHRQPAYMQNPYTRDDLGS